MSLGIEGFQITPDPGVLEINIHPVADWQALVNQTLTLDAVASGAGLGTQQYTRDGRILSTGGGAHITIGGKTPAESPLLRRPDLLRSLMTYWQHHPSLSYLFSGQFVGPTSQAPRVDEARPDGLYELEVAFSVLEQCETPSPEMIDRLLKPFMTDVTGNSHRAALCLDKLYPVDNLPLQLGLLEFRGFEMPHHPQLRLLQLLLVRALVAWFWQKPYARSLIRWGAMLQDQFFLPHCLQADWLAIIQDLKTAGYAFEHDWFKPFFDRRFPIYGQVTLTDATGENLTLELRHALEQWPVLLGEADLGSTARPVDDSMERIQVRLSGAEASRYCVLCQGQVVPLTAMESPETYVAGVRFRARLYRGMMHPVIAPQTVLTFEVVDTQTGRSLGGCTYHVHRPDGTLYNTFPKTETEAAQRLSERFVPFETTQTALTIPPPQVHLEHPLTLDLRWAKL
jgi:uncharacterized protein (DUF2126 family)